ncbi:MAG: hypothetical protein B5M51_07220 [Anaerolinea sp. 4484_236]|nr:MAG: hypothetical protein B5M51_07220 [Anaerolinea sp. 4484_236]
MKFFMVFKTLWLSFAEFLRVFSDDTKRFFAALKPQKINWSRLGIILLITAAAAVFRIPETFSAITYDEAYTYLAFTRGSLWQTISDYHLPNNHILLSLIINLSLRVLGDHLWVMRLPTLLSGILMIPAVYLLGKRLYSPESGILAAILVAALPELISFSSIARGYIIIAFFTVIVLILGDYLRQEKNLFGWALVIIFFVLGLFTIPTMLFPFAAFYVWLFLAGLFNDIRDTYSSKFDFFKIWLFSGLIVAALTVLLYAPILLFSRDDLFNNHWLIPVPWELLADRMWGKSLNTWARWTRPISAWMVALWVVGFFSSLLFHKRIAKHKIPSQFAFLVGIIIVVLVQRPNAWPRVWSFLLAPLMIWASAGVIEILKKLPLKLKSRDLLPLLLNGMALIALLWNAANIIPSFPARAADQSNVEAVAAYLDKELQDGDLVLVNLANTPALQYYLETGGSSASYVRHKEPFERVFVVVVAKGDETLSSVLKRYGPKDDPLDGNDAILMQSYGSYEIYEIFPSE